MIKANVAQEKEVISTWLETERGYKIPLQELCAIGRSENNHIVLNTAGVSRHHAVIHERDKEFWLVDLGGVNGVQVNGTRVFQPVCLQPEDRIKMPSAVFTFRRGILPEPEALKPEKKPAAPAATASTPEPAPAQIADRKETPQPTIASPNPLPSIEKVDAAPVAPVAPKLEEKAETIQPNPALPEAIAAESEVKKESWLLAATAQSIPMEPIAKETLPEPSVVVTPAVTLPAEEKKDVPLSAPVDDESTKLHGRKKRRAEWNAKNSPDAPLPITEIKETSSPATPDIVAEKKTAPTSESVPIVISAEEKIEAPPVITDRIEPVHLVDELPLPPVTNKLTPAVTTRISSTKEPPAIMIKVKRPRPGANVQQREALETQALLLPLPVKAEVPIVPTIKSNPPQPATPTGAPPTIKLKPMPVHPDALGAPTSIEPAMPPTEEKKEPLKPTSVRPAAESVWPEVKQEPLPLPVISPATSVTSPPEKEASTKESVAKPGPILIHPELVKELPMAPAPVPATPPPLALKKEPASKPVAVPPLPIAEAKEKPTPAVPPLPATIPAVETKAPVVEPKIVSVPVPVEDKKDKSVPALDPIVPTSVPPPLAKESPLPAAPTPLVETSVEEKKYSPQESKAGKPKIAEAVVPKLPPTLEGTDTRKTCVAAKRSMYVGLVSIFFPFAGIITALVAITLGHRALKLIRQSNGTLTGRDQAVTGLYFGYITLVLIAGYSTFFYFLNASTPSASTSSDPIQSLGLETPSIDLRSPHSTPGVTNPIVANTSPSKPDDTPVPLTPIHPDMPKLPHPETTAVAPSKDAPVSLAPIHPSASNPLPPLATASDQNIPAPVLPSPMPATEPSTNPPSPTKPPLITLMDSPNKNGLNVTPSALEKAAAPEQPAPVFSYEHQNRLKEEMLALPMPYENVDSTNYRDADAFNNSARLLARKPEEKYAQSVQDFIDDIKDRSPDRIRLQILMAMYQNYMAGLENGANQ